MEMGKGILDRNTAVSIAYFRVLGPEEGGQGVGWGGWVVGPLNVFREMGPPKTYL